MNESKTFASVAVTLLVLSGIFFCIERITGRGRNRQQSIFRAGWFTDVVYLFVTVLVTKPLVRLMIIVPAVLLVITDVEPLETFRSGSYRGFGPLSRQPL